jgi:hypothetical protein
LIGLKDDIDRSVSTMAVEVRATPSGYASVDAAASRADYLLNGPCGVCHIILPSSTKRLVVHTQMTDCSALFVMCNTNI